MSDFMKIPAIPVLFFACVLFTGCQSATIMVGRNPDLDIESIKRVAVVPFENLSRDKLAGDKVTAIFIASMSKITAAEIIDPGELMKALDELKAKKDRLSALQIKRIGKKINAQAMIFGSVDEFSMEKFDNAVLPVVSISARMIDVETGKVLWVATASDSGLSRVPIISIGETRTRSALAAKVIQTLISGVYLQ